jgi:hypothetical protein
MEIENDRKVANKIIQKHLLKTIVIILIYLTVMYFLSLLSASFTYIIGFILFAIFFILPMAKEKQKITFNIKSRIIPDLIHFANENFKYSPNEHISEEEFLRSNFYSEFAVDRYSGDDLIYGSVGNTKIQFSEVKAEERHRDSKGRTYYSTIFHGLFFIIDFNKGFNGSLFVIPRAVQSNFFSKFIGPRRTNDSWEKLEDVELEDPVFNEHFLVRSTDQITARFVLTPVFMNTLLSFQNKSEYETKFSFVNGKMYLGLKTKHDHFEFSLSNNINKELIKSYFDDINRALMIVEELDLNTRIWNK